jgi:hypothetical protein
MHDIVIFDDTIEHSEFSHLDIYSAGFCEIDFDNKIVKCYGKSYSTNISSKPQEDTFYSTRLIFGREAAANVNRMHKGQCNA